MLLDPHVEIKVTAAAMNTCSYHQIKRLLWLSTATWGISGPFHLSSVQDWTTGNTTVNTSLCILQTAPLSLVANIAEISMPAVLFPKIFDSISICSVKGTHMSQLSSEGNSWCFFQGRSHRLEQWCSVMTPTVGVNSVTLTV